MTQAMLPRIMGNALTLEAVDHTVVLLGIDLHDSLSFLLGAGHANLQLLHSRKRVQASYRRSVRLPSVRTTR